MIRVVAKAAGLDGLKARLAASSDVARAAANLGLLSRAEHAASDIRRTLDGESVSVPGAPPADPAGHIAASVKVEALETGAEVSVDLPYAHDLEYGTPRRAARPFLRPAAAAAGRQGADSLAAPIRNAIAQDRR